VGRARAPAAGAQAALILTRVEASRGAALALIKQFAKEDGRATLSVLVWLLVFRLVVCQSCAVVFECW